MDEPAPLSERALVLTPNGRDAQVASLILAEAGCAPAVCRDLVALAGELARGAGLVVLADEATLDGDLRPLVDYVREQPPWSDLPVILLTHRGGGPERNPAAARLADILGNVSFLERPFHAMTLATLARSALRARRRQYEARGRLEELREGEQRLRSALKAGHLGPWTLDVRDMNLRASAACRAHFGRDPGQAFSYPDFLQALHPADRAPAQTAIAKTLESHVELAVEARNIWPDGTLHWVEMRARPLKDELERLRQLVGVSSDITERKTAELERERLLGELARERAALSDLTTTLELRVQQRTAELMAEIAARERAQEQLLQAQKMESIGQLTGGVAHDFNNLLMAVIANLELLQKRFAGDARAQRLLDGAMQGAKRGASLTRRMLAFARQQELKTTPADLAALVSGMRDLLERTLGPQINLSLQLPGALPPVSVDTNQIELAILNLAINARDAMPDGGTIEIAVDQQQLEAARGVRPGPYLRLRVSDTGHGMDEATLKRAAEPFFSTKPPGKGTGLGLSMVHGLVTQLGGLLELSSTVGRGATAAIYLPVTVATLPDAPPSPAPDLASRPATILLVEDDMLIAMSTAEMLADLGHSVIEASSAKQALDILEAGQQVDLIITDHAMPGLTGTQLAEAVRRTRPELPILLATGYAEMPAGHLNLPRLAKPYQQADLKRAISGLLAAAPARAE